MNITVTADAVGWIGAWADGGSAYPANVTLFYNEHQTVATTATVPVGPDGRIKLFTWAPVDLTVDVYGYFSTTNTIDYT